MIKTGKCPKCEKTISSVSIEAIDVKDGHQTRWRGISYICPNCKTVLSVAIDPVALKTDIVKEIKGR